MKRYTMADTVKFVLMTACVLLFLLCGVSLLSAGSVAGGVVCLLLCLPYLYGALLNSTRISITPAGISKKRLWFPAELYRWEDIAELGVVGTKVIGNKKSKRTGTLYIYASPQTMTEEERFQMALRWPPKLPYFVYKPELMECCRCYWEGKVASCNSGDLVP